MERLILQEIVNGMTVLDLQDTIPNRLWQFMFDKLT